MEAAVGAVALFLAVFFTVLLLGEITVKQVEDRNAMRSFREDPLFIRKKEGVIRRLMARINAWEQSKRVDARLKQAELSVNPAEFYGFIIAGALFLSVFLNAIFNIGYPVNILFGSILAVATPVLLLFMRRNRRIERLTEQLPEAASLMASATRAGMSLTQSFAFAMHDLEEPIRGEFARVHRELQLGTPFEIALSRLGRRVPTQDYRLFIAQLLIQKEAGGNISQSLDELARTLKDRVTLNAEIRSLTAEPRMTATIVSLMPIFFILMLGMFDPTLIQPLYSSPIGIFLFILFLVVILFSFFLTRRFTRIRV